MGSWKAENSPHSLWPGPLGYHESKQLNGSCANPLGISAYAQDAFRLGHYLLGHVQWGSQLGFGRLFIRSHGKCLLCLNLFSNLAISASPAVVALFFRFPCHYFYFLRPVAQLFQTLQSGLFSGDVGLCLPVIRACGAVIRAKAVYTS